LFFTIHVQPSYKLQSSTEVLNCDLVEGLISCRFTSKTDYVYVTRIIVYNFHTQHTKHGSGNLHLQTITIAQRREIFEGQILDRPTSFLGPMHPLMQK